MTTLGDVAKLAGVSVSAVSRVLSDAPSARVSAETKERIRRAAAALDYRPNFAARALRSARSNVIALLVPDLTNAMFTGLMLGVTDAARSRGYTVLLAREETLEPQSDLISRLVGEGRVDGVLLQLGDGTNPVVIGSLAASGVPAVLLNTTRSGSLGTLALDDERATEIAAQHLIELGHRQIALATGVDRNDTAWRRSTGFRRAMTAAGLVTPSELETWIGYAPEDGRTAFRRLWGLKNPPTAVVVANVNAAIGFLGAARRAGVAVPEELSIVAIHDVWVADDTWPPLTTVRMPLYLLGVEAVAALHDRMGGGEPRHIIVDGEPPVLVLRESTAPPRD